MKAKPNILIFMTDHQRGDTVHPYNKAIMPNVNSLAANGITFKNAYCPSPHCCPSRATFFTGLYPSEHGVFNNVDVGNTLSRGLNKGVELFSEYMKKDDYIMDYSGKWHVSAEEGPQDRGFNIYDDLHKNRYKKTNRNEMPTLKPWQPYYNMARSSSQRSESEIIRSGYPKFYLYGDIIEGTPKSEYKGAASFDESVLLDALNIIENRKTSKPWCHFVGMTGPHDPYIVPQAFIDMYNIDDIELPENFYDDMLDKPALYRRTKERFSQLSDDEHRKCILNYLAFCSYEDSLFGKIMEALKDNDQLVNTIILYTSDHGDYMGEHGLWTKGLPCFKGAYHVPLIFGDFGAEIVNKKGRVVDNNIRLSDLADTILDISQTPHKNMHTIGRSLLPFMRNEAVLDWNDDLYTQSNGNEVYGIQRSVISGKWRYTFNAFDYDELYNLETDPNEMKNLINDINHSDIVKTMCEKMWKFAYKTKDACVNSYITTSFAPYGPGIIFEDE